MINFEDGIINYILYKTSKSYYFLKNIGYFYIRNNQSITINRNINLIIIIDLNLFFYI